jgi:ribulose kinase
MVRLSVGYRPDSIAIAGGATRSPLWLQLHADICDVPFILTKQTEAPMLGCAILVRPHTFCLHPTYLQDHQAHTQLLCSSYQNGDPRGVSFS